MHNKFSFPLLLALGVCSDLFPSIMGKSILACLLIFLLGYIVYEDNMLLEKLIVNRYKYLITLIFFAIYIIHQPILLILACLIIPTVKSTTLSIALIIILSAILTFLVYEVLNKIKIFNFVFGIK